MKKPTPRGEATAQTGVESHSTCISETKRETSKCRNWCEQALSYQAPSTLQLPPLHGTQHKTWEKGRFANTPENLLLNNIPQQCSPMFLAPETDFVEDNFSMDWGDRWDGLGMIWAHYIHRALYFYCYNISSTSDCQALDTRGWGPLFYRLQSKQVMDKWPTPALFFFWGYLTDMPY